MVPDSALVERFRTDLDALIEAGERIGIAVSGGPDSLALLLLAAAVRPDGIEAATVDHGLRAGSREEAETVADMCEQLGVPHAILAIEWDLPPASAIQEQARAVRYGALAQWARDAQLAALVTAHHLDDQAETLMMRLNRGAGVRGLAGMRRRNGVPGDKDLPLLRPLLGWRRSELERICTDGRVSPATDPSNLDERHERVRIRKALHDSEWLDPEALAKSAANIAAADEALEWSTDREWSESVEAAEGRIVYRASTAPIEIMRRVVSRVIAELGTEGASSELRGRELDRLLADLQQCNTTTLRGVLCIGGLDWTFTTAPPRSS